AALLRVTGPNHFTRRSSVIVLAFAISTGPTIQNSTGSLRKIRAASSNLAAPLRRLIRPRNKTRRGRSRVKRTGYDLVNLTSDVRLPTSDTSYASGITDTFSGATPSRINPSSDHSELTKIRSARSHSLRQYSQY